MSEIPGEQASAVFAQSTHLFVLGEVTCIHHHKTYLTEHGASVMSGETMFAEKRAAASRERESWQASRRCAGRETGGLCADERDVGCGEGKDGAGEGAGASW